MLAGAIFIYHYHPQAATDTHMVRPSMAQQLHTAQQKNKCVNNAVAVNNIRCLFAAPCTTHKTQMTCMAHAVNAHALRMSCILAHSKRIMALLCCVILS